MFSRVCVTPYFAHNYSETWNNLRQRLDPKSEAILNASVLHLQDILHKRIQSLQQHSSDVSIQSLSDIAAWFNLKNWFSSLNLKSCVVVFLSSYS